VAGGRLRSRSRGAVVRRRGWRRLRVVRDARRGRGGADGDAPDPVPARVGVPVGWVGELVPLPLGVRRREPVAGPPRPGRTGGDVGRRRRRHRDHPITRTRVRRPTGDAGRPRRLRAWRGLRGVVRPGDGVARRDLVVARPVGAPLPAGEPPAVVVVGGRGRGAGGAVAVAALGGARGGVAQLPRRR
jgi:hypothetical protein